MKKYVRAIIKKDNKFLLIKEHKSNQHNIWNFPGGKVDNEESTEEALQRETFEELSLIIKEVSLLHNDIYYFFNENWNGSYYLCSVKNLDAIKINEPQKCDGYCWFNINEIKQLKNLGIVTDVLDILEAML